MKRPRYPCAKPSSCKLQVRREGGVSLSPAGQKGENRVGKIYYNAEHYPDPTAGQAIANIMREERRRRRPRVYRYPIRPREAPGHYPFKEAFEDANFIPS